MAEKKYDMLLGPKRDSCAQIKHQPWYRERLISKYKYDRKPALDTSTWTFVKGGVDDFRDGKLIVPQSSMIFKGSNGIPFNEKGLRKPAEHRIKNCFTKNEAIYSRATPNQLKRRKKVRELENSLLSHPLALYPDIGKSVSKDVFQGIVSILDPILAMGGEIPYVDSNNLPTERIKLAPASNVKFASKHRFQPAEDDIDSVYITAIRDLAKRNAKEAQRQEEESSKEDKSRLGRRKIPPTHVITITSPSLSPTESVTRDFCDWIKNLGGEDEKYNIEETSIKRLFANSCEAKNPVLPTPVKVVELSSVPPDLHHKNNHLQTMRSEEDNIHNNKNTQGRSKIQYGAWYLEPQTWKARPIHETLSDPKQDEGKKMSSIRQKSKELDTILSESHGLHSFRLFIERKGCQRKPDFLETIPTNTKVMKDVLTLPRFNEVC